MADAGDALSGFHPSCAREETYFTSEETAQAYDSYIGVNIPYYWPAFHFAARILAEMFAGRGGLRCVELGAGTGNFLLILLESLPVAECLLVDHSEPMVAIASKKLRGSGCGVAARAVSFLSDSWTEIPGFEKGDIVLSSWALDHVHSDAELLALFGKIYWFLLPGGCFVLAEKCANGNDRGSVSWRSFERMIGIRERHMLKSGLKTPAETARWKQHILTDDCLRPLGSLWHMAEKAGFIVHLAAGVALPAPDDLNDDLYYAMTSVSTFSRAAAFATDAAYGLGMLFCLKPLEGGAALPVAR